MKKPIIGITLDYETTDSYSVYPWYALRENYTTAVWKAGGIPVLLPHFPEASNLYLSMIDGLILTGGNFDIAPSFYGEQITSDKVMTKDRRTAFESEICRQALKSKLPILGICGGEQLLNVILGGSLIQHIPDTVANALEHEQTIPRDQQSHKIKVQADSLLYRITGRKSFMVNSTHHQAVKTLGHNAIMNAIAPDGVIEGIEIRDYPFGLGVQWHPEYLSTEEDVRIFDAFLASCR